MDQGPGAGGERRRQAVTQNTDVASKMEQQIDKTISVSEDAGFEMKGSGSRRKV
jgi:hypothetical protein